MGNWIETSPECHIDLLAGFEALEWRNSVLHVSNSSMRRRGFVPFVGPPSKRSGLWMLPLRCRKDNCHPRSCLRDLQLEPARMILRSIPLHFPASR